MADSDHLSPQEIEDEIERERAALGETLEEVNHRLSFDNVTRQVTEGLRENTGEIAHSITQAVKDNPVAVALTAVGLVWLMIGSGSRKTSYRRDYYGEPYDDLYGGEIEDDYDPFDGSRLTGRSSRPQTARDLYERSSADRTRFGQSTDYGDADEGRGFGDRLSSMSSAIRDRVRSAGSKVRNAADQAGHKMSDAADSTRDTMGNAADSTRHRASDASHRASDGLRQGGKRLRASASELRERMSHGLEDMSDAARERVLQAREAAIEARDRAQRMAAQSRERASDLYDDQPLVAGALALAVGAALGAMLPRTDYEDDVFGEESDHLMDEAERIYREERSKLGAVASAAADEARKMGSEAVDTVKEKADAERLAGQAEAAAKSAGKRVADAAREEADRQNLGSSVTGDSSGTSGKSSGATSAGNKGGSGGAGSSGSAGSSSSAGSPSSPKPGS